MALSDKKYERMFSTTGSDADKIDTDTFNDIKEDFDQNRYILDVGHFKMLGPVIYQIQLLTEELDALRSEISANKDKTGITTAQANAITANTAKTSMTLGTSGSTALAGDTTTISTTQANEITAEFTTTVSGKTTTYSLPITVVETDTSGKSTVTTTKTGSITLS